MRVLLWRGFGSRRRAGTGVASESDLHRQHKPAREGARTCSYRSGKVSDSDSVRAALDRWVKELAPGATGWLGSTTGVTEDGTLVALARFESAEAARANSDRLEQTEWWTETSKLFTIDVTFHDSDNVFLGVVGDPDRAGFVQIMEGRSSDAARSRELMEQNVSLMAKVRSDVLARLVAEYDGSWTMAIYFTSEKAAREGEQKQIPAEVAAQMQELQTLMVGVPDYYDLKQPWMDSPT
jgi:hypothetical protein